MGTIHKYKTKLGQRFQAQIRHNSNQKRYMQSRTFDTKKEAQNWIQEQEFLLKSQPVNQTDSSPTLNDLLDYYRQHDMTRKAQTTQRAQTTILNYWSSVLGATKLNELTPRLIRHHQNILEHKLDPKTGKKEKSTGTVKNYMIVLQAMLNTCIKELSWLDKSPMQYMKLPKDNKPRTRSLTAAEEERLFDACQYVDNPHITCLVQLAIRTGLRFNECMQIKLEHIDFNNNLIVIPDTKNGTTHTVYITDKLKEIIHYHIACLFHARDKSDPVPQEPYRSHHRPESWNHIHYDGLSLTGNAYLFPAQRGNKPAYVIKAWRRVRSIAKLDVTLDGAKDKSVVFHTLRHTFGSSLANAGRTILDIATSLNHKDLRSTKRYTHITEARSRANFEVMDALLP